MRNVITTCLKLHVKHYMQLCEIFDVSLGNKCDRYLKVFLLTIVML